MDAGLYAFIEAGKMLDRQPIPNVQFYATNYAWMTKETYLALGGTSEDWERIASAES